MSYMMRIWHWFNQIFPQRANNSSFFPWSVVDKIKILGHTVRPSLPIWNVELFRFLVWELKSGKCSLPFHSQELSISNFTCMQPHQKYYITQYCMKNLAFHTVTYSDERWLCYSIITTSVIHLSIKGWENVLFEQATPIPTCSSNGKNLTLILHELDMIPGDSQTFLPSLLSLIWVWERSKEPSLSSSALVREPDRKTIKKKPKQTNNSAKSLNSSNHQPANQPTNQPTNQPANQPTSQPANQPTSQPTSQSINQPTKQTIHPPTNQQSDQTSPHLPANQHNQPNHPPTNQQNTRTTN